jgi:hypothetical protein
MGHQLPLLLLIFVGAGVLIRALTIGEIVIAAGGASRAMHLLALEKL